MSKVSKEKKIKKLKTKHIWPSIVVFIITMAFAAILIFAMIDAFIVYELETKFSPLYDDAAYITSVVNEAGGTDISSASKEIESINLRSNSMKDAFVIDENNNIISGIGSFTADTGLKLNIMVDDSIGSYFDKDNKVSWIGEEGIVIEEIVPVLVEALKYDEEQGSQEFLNEVVAEFSVWSLTPMESSGNYLAVKADISMLKRDLIFVVIIAIFTIAIILVPLIFLLCNVISNVKTQRRMLKLLYLDSVTGGNNWSYFVDEGKHLLEKRSNKAETYAVLDFELMKYRSFCACCGIEEAEQILERMYSIINGNISKKELCVRYAKANFALLLKCKDTSDADARIDEMMQMLSEVAGEHRAVFHVGYIMVGPNCDQAGKPLRRKDVDIAAMYNSAAEARASVVGIEGNTKREFTELLLENQRWEHKVEDEMEAALANKEFEVYYQPKYNPMTEELAGAEALIRWIKPDGIVPPGKFIPIFEKNGFITQIDDYMISNVAKQQSEWLKAGKKIVPVSVNVSRAHFTQEDLAEHILSLVDAYEVPHKYIEIELTESAFFDDKNVLLSTVKKLKSYGFELSMDDFGAGYSSLNSLKDLPLDVLKLDADFFRGEENLDRAEIVVSEAISLAKQLNMRIVAEGIEQKHQVEFLAGLECDMIQGYYYAKPMPASDYENRMK